MLQQARQFLCDQRHPCDMCVNATRVVLTYYSFLSFVAAEIGSEKRVECVAVYYYPVNNGLYSSTAEHLPSSF